MKISVKKYYRFLIEGRCKPYKSDSGGRGTAYPHLLPGLVSGMRFFYSYYSVLCCAVDKAVVMLTHFLSLSNV
jgi:hypothetical protein